ncbi:MAG: Hpt domain-containing protein, partial [Pseudomonadota bacterium]
MTVTAPPRFFPRPIHDALRELSDALLTIEHQLAVVADSGNHAHELAVVLPMLIEARDVCALTGLNGPHLLLVEMVRVVEGVIEGDFDQPDDAETALMFAAAKLPGYVQRMVHGGRDVPLALMPALNDLRAVRNAPLFSDAVMRLPLFRLPPDDLGASSEPDALSATAQRIRPHFMRALLSLIRGQSPQGALEHLAWSLNALRDGSRRRSVRMLWLVARAVIDGLRSGSLELKPATKTLLGQIERCVKLAVEKGERDLVNSLPPELLRNMLFYCAQAGDASDVLTVVRQRYRLEDLVAARPDTDDELKRANAALAPSLLSAARDQVQGELERVRDAVLAFAHSDVSVDETLRPAGLLLERVCETLGVLGMSSTRTTLFASVPMFRGIRDRRTNARALATLAEVLLQGSRLLDSELDRQRSSSDDLDCSQELDVEQSALSRMPRDERKELLKAVITQLRAALDGFEVAVVSHLSLQSDTSALSVQEACEGLRDANRALDIVSLRAAHDAFGRLVNVLSHMPLDAYRHFDDRHPVVRSVAALDLYLRALADNDLNGRGFLRTCFTALTELEQQCADELQAVAAAAAPEAAVVSHTQPGVETPAMAGHPLDDAEGVARYRVDTALRDIYLAEAREQLSAVRQYAQLRLDDAGGLFVDDKLVQLLDNLVRRSQLAEVGGVAVPLLQLSRIFSLYHRRSASVPAIEMQLVDRVFSSVEHSLGNLEKLQACDPDAVDLSHELSSLAAVLGLGSGEEVDDTTHELRAVFAEEADELIAAATHALADWQASADDSAATQRLMRALHTLKGSARVAGWNSVAESAHALESMVTLDQPARATDESPDFGGIQRGLDHIAELLSGDQPQVVARAAPEVPSETAPHELVVETHSNDSKAQPLAVSDAPVDPQDVTDDNLRVSSHEIGSLTALANDVALH